MNGRYFTGEPIEQRLDRLIDALNSGRVPDHIDHDPELDELAAAVRATAAARETQWPDSGFGRRMAIRLATELRDTIRFDQRHVDDRMFDLPTSPATLNGHAPDATGDRHTFELTQPGNQRRLRAFAQIAAAIAGFAILSVVLIAIFRDAPDGQTRGNTTPESTTAGFAGASATPSPVASATAKGGVMALVPTPPSTPNASLAIVPYALSCAGSAAVVGSEFAPNSTVDIFISDEVPESPNGSELVSTTADDNGYFKFEELVPVTTLIPDCEERAANGGGELTFSAASIIEVDGQQSYAEPAAHTPVSLTATNQDQTAVRQAFDAAREFLGEPDTTFDVIEVNEDDGYVRISRQVDGAYDEFRYSMTRREIVSATIQTHSSVYVPSNPVNADRALEIAEAMAAQHHGDFDQLELHDTSDVGTVPGSDGQHQVFSATWQMKANGEVWVPTKLQIDVDMQTGRVIGYWFTEVPYNGTLDAQITREDAVNAVEDAIATEPTLTGATVGTVELNTGYQATDDKWILVWRIYLEDAPESAPGLYIDVDAQTGDLLTDFGEPGGAG